MCSAVVAVSDAHETEWTGFPPLAGPYTDFKVLLGNSYGKLSLQATQSQGTTNVKSTQRADLEQIVLQVANALVVYGQMNGLPLADEAYTTPSMVERFAEKALVGH